MWYRTPHGAGRLLRGCSPRRIYLGGLVSLYKPDGPFQPLWMRDCARGRSAAPRVLGRCHGSIRQERAAHSAARGRAVFREEKRIVLRPQYQLFSLKFRTAWPMKGSIELEPEGDATKLTCVKQIPWSSALLTLLWFAVVGVGTVGFTISFLASGGFTSFSGFVMGLGITGLGLLVLAFGLTTVSLAYRLENQRLTEVYHELRAALASDRPRPL